MKIYTEEQVRKVIIFLTRNEFAEEIIKNIVSDLTPIELPSDEVIDKESFIINPPKIQNDYGKDYDDNIQYRDEWVGGAKWVIEQIKQKDNGK